MDWNVIIVAILGLFGSIFSAYLTNRINVKNQERIIELEINKQRLSNESEINKIKIQKDFEITNNLINYEIKYKSEAFSNYSYFASHLKYSNNFYKTTHYDYLKAYNQACTATNNENVLSCIHKVHTYININRMNSVAYDTEFEELLDELNKAFISEIQQYKVQLKNINTQES